MIKGTKEESWRVECRLKECKWTWSWRKIGWYKKRCTEIGGRGGGGAKFGNW